MSADAARERVVVLGCGTVGPPFALALAVRGFEVCGTEPAGVHWTQYRY